MRNSPLALPLALLALPFAAACGDTEAIDDEGWLPEGKADEVAVPLRYGSYEVLFTNPLCREYTYATPQKSADGSKTLTAKPKNVFCSRTDIPASAARAESPQNKLLTWLTPLGAGDEIFLAYLSFSNQTVGDELCAAIGRGAKVTFVLDAPSSASDKLKTCGATILLRGHAGSIGYAHNKVILINPRGDSELMKMTFSSGNMSSGVVTHHENWHFIEVARDSYFAQAHVCLMDAQVSPTASSGRTQYKTALNACRAEIDAPEETDIKAFFIPNRDDAKRGEVPARRGRRGEAHRSRRAPLRAHEARDEARGQAGGRRAHGAHGGGRRSVLARSRRGHAVAAGLER